MTCGFEATGNYHRPIAWRLLQAGFDVRLISSLALARTREALHNGWDKNDPKGAQVIRHMLRIGATQRYHDPLPPWQRADKCRVHKVALFASVRIHPGHGMLLRHPERNITVHVLGLSMFLLSVPIGLAGLCDPKPARGNIVMALAACAMPAGLIAATL